MLKSLRRWALASFRTRRWMAAARLGDVAAMDVLLAEGQDVDEAPGLHDGGGDSPLSERGNTALHEAAAAGHTEAVVFLLAHGANPTPANYPMGETPAHCAAQGMKLDTLAAMAAYAPDVLLQKNRFEKLPEDDIDPSSRLDWIKKLDAARATLASDRLKEAVMPVCVGTSSRRLRL